MFDLPTRSNVGAYLLFLICLVSLVHSLSFRVSRYSPPSFSHFIGLPSPLAAFSNIFYIPRPRHPLALS